ncbi:unnamed protein product [Effrenium voratum]|nr:unnamed protein product [Effrenium voratum]
MISACHPWSQCKVVHFVRHAEAESNAAAHQFPRDSAGYLAAYADEQYFDSVLSEKGQAQCAELQLEVQGLQYEAVVCSPLRRTLQTASLAFTDRSVPWLAVESAREFSEGHARPCDYRRARSAQAAGFGFVDFRQVPEGEDSFAARKESPQDVDSRCRQLLALLAEMPQKSIAVVSHTGFLSRLFAHHLAWGSKAAFRNAELRSVVLCFEVKPPDSTLTPEPIWQAP